MEGKCTAKTLKNEQCKNKAKENGFCYRHSPSYKQLEPKNENSCNVVITRGVNKGKECGRVCRGANTLCSSHIRRTKAATSAVGALGEAVTSAVAAVEEMISTAVAAVEKDATSTVPAAEEDATSAVGAVEMSDVGSDSEEGASGYNFRSRKDVTGLRF